MAAKKAPPASDSTRVFLAEDDTPGVDLEAAAEQQRRDAWGASYTWHGKELQPWSIGREQLYFRLRAADAPLPLQVALQHPESFLGDAAKVLYLCHHEPSEWRVLRMDIPAFIEAIDAWSEENIQRHEQSEAIDLALKIMNDSASTHAIARPSPQKSPDSGN